MGFRSANTVVSVSVVSTNGAASVESRDARSRYLTGAVRPVAVHWKSGVMVVRAGGSGATGVRLAIPPAAPARPSTRAAQPGRGRRMRSGGIELAEADADDRRDARLLHRDPVDRVGRLHGARIVGDHDELRLILELLQQAHVAPHVRVVERRVYLVEQAERAGAREEDGEQQRHGDEGPLARRQQVDALGALAARRRVDLDLAGERLVFVREA